MDDTWQRKAKRVSSLRISVKVILTTSTEIRREDFSLYATGGAAKRIARSFFIRSGGRAHLQRTGCFKEAQ